MHAVPPGERDAPEDPVRRAVAPEDIAISCADEAFGDLLAEWRALGYAE